MFLDSRDALALLNILGGFQWIESEISKSDGNTDTKKPDSKKEDIKQSFKPLGDDLRRIRDTVGKKIAIQIFDSYREDFICAAERGKLSVESIYEFDSREMALNCLEALKEICNENLITFNYVEGDTNKCEYLLTFSF